MKNLLNPAWILLIGFLFVQHLSIAQSSQRYDNSLKLQYGLFQYSNNQQDFISTTPNSFLNVGLTYRQRLSRLTDLNLTGRYYDWNLKNGDVLKTYAFQPMWVLHTSKISSSWRLNRITPYLGIGIGVENHVLTHANTDSSYWKMYVPVEIGLQFNLNSRWSVGVFAEYKFATYTTLKNLVTSANSSLDIVNSSGISLSYNFGKNKKSVLFPVIRANPALTDAELVFINEKETPRKTDNSFETRIKNNEIMGILADPVKNPVKPINSVTPIETEKHNIIVIPKVTTTISDTITVPIHINISVNTQDEKPVVSKPGKAKSEEKISPAYEKKIDSLLNVVKLQNIKLNKIDSANRLINKRSGVKDTIVIHTISKVPAKQSTPTIAVADNSKLAATVAQNTGKTDTIQAGMEKLQRDLDITTKKIQQMESEKAKSTAAQVSETPEVNPAVIVVGKDSLLTPVKAKDTIIIKIITPPSEIENILPAKAQKADSLSAAGNDSITQIKLSLDSLSQNQKFLMQELKNLKTQNEELQKKSMIESPKTDIIVKPVVSKNAVYTIAFAVNSSRVSAKFLPELKVMADSLKKIPGKKIQLSGYSDKSGQASYNLVLSQKRVKAVKNELIKLGISKKQMVEQYFGSELSTGEVNINDRKVVIRLL